MVSGHASAQHRDDLIAASQAGASPLFFQPAAGTPLVSTGNFFNEKECAVRNGLPHFFQKAASGKPLLIGFIGGSITQGNMGYRPQTVRYLQAMYPAVKVSALNAGVSGTGTDLGACRIKEQLLQHRPDLVFVEFAVNGAYAEGMEGIVRQVRQYDPAVDICFIYTINGLQTKTYAAGEVPVNVQGLEKIAEHYGLPSVHLGLQPSLLEQQGKLIWKGDLKDSSGSIIFSTDGIHPVQAGGDIYAAAIARGLEKMKAHATTVGTHAVADNKNASVPHVVTAKGTHPAAHTKTVSAANNRTAAPLPAPIFPGNWEDAGMYNPKEIAQFSTGWEPVTLPQFAAWFPVIQQASTPGASFTFRFKGTGFGIFDVGGPEAGQITIQVNGQNMQVQPPLVPGTQVYRLVQGDSIPVNRFSAYCNNRYRGQHQLFTLEPGEHTVTIRLSSRKADKAAILGPTQQEDIQQHPEKYSRSTLYLGKILIKGTPVLNGNH